MLNKSVRGFAIFHSKHSTGKWTQLRRGGRGLYWRIRKPKYISMAYHIEIICVFLWIPDVTWHNVRGTVFSEWNQHSIDLIDVMTSNMFWIWYSPLPAEPSRRMGGGVIARPAGRQSVGCAFLVQQFGESVQGGAAWSSPRGGHPETVVML